jgi:hypothetical protein
VIAWALGRSSRRVTPRTIAGRYQLDDCLGRGGQAEVWSAVDRITCERVAIKILGPGWGMPAARARREVATLRVLRLPGVVRLLDEGAEEGRTFVVMDLVTGTPFPGCDVPCSWSRLAPVALRLLETLRRVHAAGVLHRDLKPANVLVTADGLPVLLDFGLASTREVLSADLTLDGQLVGTPAYLAPEQIDGDRMTERTDLYAVGLMLFEALTGRRPQEGTVRELLVARTTMPVQPLHDAAPGVPAAVASVVDALLSIRPEDRPASALEAARALAQDMARDPWPAADGPLRGVREARDEQPQHALTEEALRPLFAVPDRLLHLKEDAARVLRQRTGGVPARVLEELAAWGDAGLCCHDAAGFHIERDAIDSLEADFQSADRLRRIVATQRDGDELGQALAIAAESSSLALDLARDGKLGHAVVALAEGVRALRHGAPSALDVIASLLAQWTAVALAEDTPKAIDRVLYENCRTTPRTQALDAHEQLLRAALAVGEWSDRPLDLLDALPPFADVGLERLRQRLRVSASRRCGRDRAARTVEDAAEWARASCDSQALAELAWWTGRLRYREGRFDEAARLCDESAARLAWTTERVAARVHAATAAMEAFQYEVAARWAAEAREAASICRNALLEGRAAWIERSLAYRLDRAGAPDLELVDAAARIGSLELLEAPLRRTEAAVAWRLGDRRLGRELAVAARDIGARLGESMGARLLAAGLAVACGDPATPAERETVARDAVACDTPGVGVQVLALLAVGEGRARCEASTALRLASQVERAHWGERLDVLSVNESLAHCGVCP